MAKYYFIYIYSFSDLKGFFTLEYCKIANFQTLFEKNINYCKIPIKIANSRGAGAQTCDYKRELFWIRIPLMEMKYLIFSFLPPVLRQSVA